MNTVKVTLLLTAGVTLGLAQQTYVVNKPADGVSQAAAPIYKITVTSRTIKAINFHHRQGSTELDLVGTALLPEGKGTVRVDSKTGATKVDAWVEKMKPAEQIGPEFLTYVLWAITPEGRPQNLGEVHLESGTKAKISAATELQSFGLIVTAEPYYAVTQPSSAVVLENVLAKGTAGTIMPIDAKYELLERSFYETQATTPGFRGALDRNTPLDLREARSAMAIATSVGGERYAADTMEKARVDLNNAEDLARSKGDTKRIETLARHATQLFEDARLITVRKQRVEQDELTKAQAAEAERKAVAEAAARTEAERERLAAKAEAEQARAAAERARMDEQAARQRAAQIRQQAEADKARLEQEALEAKRQRTELREQLRQQFSAILETRETARGLILNVSDVLFDTGQATLKADARERLAKVSGILLAHPELRIEAEGHTDSVGSDDFNQKLSERRAASVANFLREQGVRPDSLASRGFGEAQPIASNDTTSGRQQNRRVELVVSGESMQTALPSSGGIHE